MNVVDQVVQVIASQESKNMLEASHATKHRCVSSTDHEIAVRPATEYHGRQASV